MVEAALCKLTPGLRKYLDADDELRRQFGRDSWSPRLSP
jgi:hypothetical protein